MKRRLLLSVLLLLASVSPAWCKSPGVHDSDSLDMIVNITAVMVLAFIIIITLLIIDYRRTVSRPLSAQKYLFSWWK